MLSEKGLLIIEKLAEHNNELVTSKALAASTDMSERSVKTYLKEVADFCEQNSMTLDRKPGKGMKPCFSDAQIGKILDVAGRRSAAVSQKKRQNYISYILLSGWDTYTYALFSEELNVSKNVIMDDINELDAELVLFGIKVHRTAIIGRTSGRTICQKRRKCPAPSNFADSSSEIGTVSKYPFINQAFIGIPPPT